MAALHPARADQTIACVRGVEHRWTEWAVPLHAWVMRWWHKKQQCTAPMILITTALKLSTPWSVRPYEKRPEMELGYEQMKSGGW